MAEFPGSVPTDRQSSTSEYLSNMASGFGHVALHNFHNNEIRALATKLGTGSSTSIAGTVLRGTGAGVSAWGQIDLANDLAAFTSAQLAARLSDETGGGAAVFGTAPTISNPTITGGGSWTGSPTLTTPTIPSLTNAQHDHTNAAGGGTLGNNIITNAMLSTTAGQPGGVWNSYSSALTGITQGNGILTARYIQVGKMVDFYVLLTLGNTSAITSATRVGLPVAAKSTYITGNNLSGYAVSVGVATLKDDSAGAVFNGPAYLVDVNTVTMDVWLASSSYVQAAAVSAIVPFSWNTDDAISVFGRYEAE